MSRRAELLRAQDVYPTWKRIVSRAQSSVSLFSPYLDGLVTRLLASSSLPPSAICVITDLSPASGAVDYRAQLKTLKVLLGKGYEVKTLDRLHAKVLLVDGSLVIAGSQNFTNYARQSRECTAVPGDSLAGTSVVETLMAWQSSAAVVSADLVDYLLEELDEVARAAKKASDDLLAVFAWERDAFEEAARVREQKRWESLISRSEARLGQETALACLDWVTSSSTFDSYRSLVAGTGSDLTNWVQRRNGHPERVVLPRLMMCPIILTDSGQMGFARVAKTRITYVRSVVAWTKPASVAGLNSTVTVTFPTDRVHRRNISVEFHPTFRPDLNCRTDVLFDGESLKVVATSSTRGGRPPADFQDYAKACRECFEDPTVRREFFAEYIATRFTYTTLGRERQNAETYFEPRTYYRIRLVEFDGMPLLALTKE